ncbi:MAG: hypothetical protein ACNA8S_08720 [Deferrisomatales bacterium]
MARKLEVALRMHGGHAVGERVLLPASYVMTLAFRERDRQRIDDLLPDLFKTCQAEFLSDKIAQHASGGAGPSLAVPEPI